MKIKTILSSICCGLLLVTQISAQVITPSGVFTCATVGGDGALNIWDISGTYNANATLGSDEPLALQFPFTILVDAKGKISGAGIVPILIDTNTSNGDYTVKGTFSGAGSNATAKFTVKLSGDALIEGQTRAFKGTINYILQLDTTTRHLTGTGNGTATASGLGKTTIQSNPDFALVPAMDGRWSASLDFDNPASGTKLFGVATVTLSNSRTLPFDFTGKFEPVTGTSTLKLKGGGSAKGAKLAIVAVGNPIVSKAYSGSALGNDLP